MSAFVLHALPQQGRALVPDQDHVLAEVRASQLLLINLTPGVYPYESHALPEYLFCLSGQLVLEAASGERVSAAAGEMIEVRPNVSHHFAAEVDAVIMTVAQSAGV